MYPSSTPSTPTAHGAPLFWLRLVPWRPGLRVTPVAALFAVGLLLAAARGEENWARQLGYPAGTRVLLLHSDDAGMCYEANAAVKRYLTEGDVPSASVMMPCPWADEFLDWLKSHPGLDVGVHFTLNAEWKHYRWGPVAPRAEVPGLIDPRGLLWREPLQTAMFAKPVEVEKEIRAQLKRFTDFGIRPTHIDSHMGTLFARPEFAKAFLALAVEERIPAMFPKVSDSQRGVIERFAPGQWQQFVEAAKTYPLPKVDAFEAVPRGDTYEEKLNAFFAMVRGLEPGLVFVYLHPSVESEALRHITGSWQQRIWEAEMFRDPRVKEFYRAEQVVLTTWTEVMERFSRSAQ